MSYVLYDSRDLRYTGFMEQHPIPRQITTFEFKLIGFLTLHQFLYLIVFLPLGYIVFRLFPIPYVSMALGILVSIAGVAFAFVPINDRPLDVWIRNMIKRLTSPTQYIFHKENKPLYFLSDLYFAEDPRRTVSHIESRDKIAAYLAKTKPVEVSRQKNAVHSLFSALPHSAKKKSETIAHYTPISSKLRAIAATRPASPSGPRTPYATGIVKNHKLIPIPGVLIYVKNEKSETVRLLKTNPHGVFATFSALSPGKYTFEVKDPRSTYFFDTMNVTLDNSSQKPLEIHSRELL